ncbi:NAD(P)H-dependent glycerol-3-phosphate dehydrogenase [Amphibiibacter pelophylacis]|uniref:NAD(P)H-dependent glycerol-3-phosphate dehydrogenase n=1 Tax=Amphibiibacter pelophylacis TaxID=1799477 RepID=A0ACC6P0F9_9BURK
MPLVVLGAGAWGTAMAMALARAGRSVTLCPRSQAHCDELTAQRANPRYLPGLAFPPSLALHALPDAPGASKTHEADETQEAAVWRPLPEHACWILAAPMAGLRAQLAALQRQRPGARGLWLCKGFEAGSGLLGHEVAQQVLGDGPGGATRFGVLTGPSFAREVAQGLPAALVCAGEDAAWMQTAAQLIHHDSLRVYAGDDIVGAEVGGAVKNVMAIAAGLCDGLHLGHNARAALITRGLAEITRLGVALGAQPATFMGLSGLGDLTLTASGDLSRNRRVGLELASGRALDDIVRTLGHVAEGVYCARAVAQRARQLGVDMPITGAVVEVLEGRLSPQDAVRQLMQRGPRSEH